MDNEHFESKKQLMSRTAIFDSKLRLLSRKAISIRNYIFDPKRELVSNKSDLKPQKQLLGSNGRNFLLTYYSYLKNIKLTSAKHRSFPKIKVAIFPWSDMKLIRFRYCKIFIKLSFRNSKLNTKVCAFEIIS